jgi:hypothetical protein
MCFVQKTAAGFTESCVVLSQKNGVVLNKKWWALDGSDDVFTWGVVVLDM